MTSSRPIAAVLASGEPERLYSGLSLLVSAAGEGAPCSALLAFRALDLVLDQSLLQRAQEPELTPALAWAGRERFATSLVELLDTARALDQVSLYACSASVDTMNVTPAQVEEFLDGIMSTPRFLAQTADAELIFV